MNAKGKKRLKLCLQLLYILGTLGLIYGLGRSDPEMISLFSGRLTLKPLWLALCAGGMMGYWLLQACVYTVAGRVAGGPMSFGKNFSMMLLGEYYSALTPFASGGQPMQLGYYKRYGVGLAKGSCILAVRYMGYVGAICLCALAALCWEGRQMLARFPVVFGLTLLGFLINLGSIIMVGLILVRPQLAQRLGCWCLKQCARLAPRRGAAWQERFDQGVEEFKAAGRCLRAAQGKCWGIMGLSLLSVISEFAIAYFVYRALGLTGAPFIQLFGMQVFLYLAVAFAPTPGAAGVTEGGFYLFFAAVFPKPLLVSAMLLWRLFTYYSQLLAGAAVVIGGELRSLRRQRRVATPSGHGEENTK